MKKEIPGNVFNPDYPANPQNFGEALRKARIDAGLQIKELAKEIGANEMSVINWEIRGKMPAKRNMEKLKGIFPEIEVFFTKVQIVRRVKTLKSVF